MKKKIGISFSRTNFHYYWNWFTKDDLQNDIELIELSFEKNNVADIHLCDAFVLTGGVDIHPSFYKGHNSYLNQPEEFQIERDLFEKKIYEYSQQHSLPLLAICRGMQLINVLHGGKLLQDLEQSNALHKKEEDDKIHHIQFVPGFLLNEISRQNVSDINSAHHQAIDPMAIGENLIVNAVAEDDAVIEGIEFNDKTGKAFMLGVQWHPERMRDKETHPLSKNIKERFLKEVRSTNMKKLTIINPATEEVIAELNQDTEESVANKFDLLRKGQKEWQKVALTERINVLQKFSGLLQKNIEQLASILTS